MEILSGNKSIIPKPWFDYLESICEAELNKASKKVKVKRIKRQAYVSIPDVKREKIKAEIERTGVWTSVLLKKHGRLDIDPRYIGRVISGQQIKGLEQDIDDIIDLYAMTDDLRESPERTSVQTEYRPVIDLEIQTIEHHIDHTGVSPTQLPKEAISGVRFYTIRAWLIKRVKTCLPDEMERVLSVYRNLPSKPTFADPEEKVQGFIRIKVKMDDIRKLSKSLPNG